MGKGKQKQAVAAIPDGESSAGVKELSRTVALLVPNLGSPFHIMLFRGINEALGAEGFDILYHNVGPEDREDSGTLESLRMNRPAGYIILRGGEGRDSEHARTILEDGVPLVSLGRITGLETNTVGIDDPMVMRLATDHVIERGHRRLCYFAGPPFFKASKYRQQGFLESLAAHGIPLSEALIVSAGVTPQDGYLAALDVLKDPKTRPTAILCFNDMLAAEVYRAARELSLEIPRDVSVVGVDNVEYMALLEPALTTVDIFPEQSGRMAAELIVKAIRNQLGTAPVVQTIEPKLVERNSVRSI